MVAHILERHGLELLPSTGTPTPSKPRWSSTLERAHHAQSSISIALRAIVESRRGRFDTAESWFNQALARAGDDDLQMIEIKYLYACDFMQRFRLDCIPLLEAHANDENVPANLRARILSALGLALTIADRPEAARAAIDEAMAIAPWADGDGELRPLLLARAAYVYQDEPETGRHFALTSAEAAVASSAFGIATSAYSVALRDGRCGGRSAGGARIFKLAARPRTEVRKIAEPLLLPRVYARDRGGAGRSRGACANRCGAGVVRNTLRRRDVEGSPAAGERTACDVERKVRSRLPPPRPNRADAAGSRSHGAAICRGRPLRGRRAALAV